MTATRWTPQRKLELLNAIYDGKTTLRQAAAEHALSVDELASWSRRYARHGRDGLKSTKTQELPA